MSKPREHSVRIQVRLGGGRMVRRDPSPLEEVEEQPRPEGNWLIERLRRAMGLATDERRAALRHEVVDHDVWVGWWRGDEFGAALGQLVNLSRTGALVVLGDRPPRKLPIWLYKDVGPTLACVRAELIGLQPAPRGEFSARFQFAAPCPTVFCQAALCGTSEPSSRELARLQLGLDAADLRI